MGRKFYPDEFNPVREAQIKAILGREIYHSKVSDVDPNMGCKLCEKLIGAVGEIWLDLDNKKTSNVVGKFCSEDIIDAASSKSMSL